MEAQARWFNSTKIPEQKHFKNCSSRNWEQEVSSDCRSPSCLWAAAVYGLWSGTFSPGTCFPEGALEVPHDTSTDRSSWCHNYMLNTQTDRGTHRGTDRQTNRETDRQTVRQTNRETNRQTDMYWHQLKKGASWISSSLHLYSQLLFLCFWWFMNPRYFLTQSEMTWKRLKKNTEKYETRSFIRQFVFLKQTATLSTAVWGWWPAPTNERIPHHVFVCAAHQAAVWFMLFWIHFALSRPVTGLCVGPTGEDVDAFSFRNSLHHQVCGARVGHLAPLQSLL